MDQELCLFVPVQLFCLWFVNIGFVSGDAGKEHDNRYLISGDRGLCFCGLELFDADSVIYFSAMLLLVVWSGNSATLCTCHAFYTRFSGAIRTL